MRAWQRVLRGEAQREQHQEADEEDDEGPAIAFALRRAHEAAHQQAAAREQIWTPEKDKEESSPELWTPGSS